MQPSQQEQVAEFFEKNRRNIRAQKFNTYLIDNNKELSFKIGSKRSNRSGKIYDVGRKGTTLKFEMEIRRSVIAAYKSNYILNHVEEIEDSLIKEFLYFFWKRLDLNSEFTDWLCQKVRPLVNNNRSSSIIPYISTDYMKYERQKLSSLSINQFIMFLKFIRFTKKLNHEIKQFENIDYRIIIFKVKDFSKECDSLFKSTDNFYKINQVKKFLQQLQQNIFVEIFNDSDSIKFLNFLDQPIVEIDRLAGIHRVTVFKQKKSNCLFARVVLMDDLFHYQYPFQLPNLFEKKLTKHEKMIRIEFIKTFSSKRSEKIFSISHYLKIYKVSNQQTKNVKQIFIDMIKIFQQDQLIEDQALLLNGSPINIRDLTTVNISNGVILYEKFHINSFPLNKI